VGWEHRLTNFEAHFTRNGPAAKDSDPCAAGVAEDRAQRHPPVILTRRHSNGRNLAAITPLSQEGHDEGLHPGRAEEQ